MKHRIIFILGILLSLQACNNEEEEDFTLLIDFMPMYEGAEMHLGTRYNNAHDCTFALSDLKFYLSNLTLHNTDGSKRLLSEIELIDFRNHHHSLNFAIEGGKYSAISFDIGVPVHLNGTQNPDFLTSVYSLDHPLSASNGTYWSWQTGYRFFMADGRYDVVPNSTEDNLTLFSFHTGRDTLFRQAGPFAKSLSRARGSNNVLQFALDFDKFWASATDTVDLRVENNFHGSPSQMELGHRLANNSVQMFRILP